MPPEDPALARWFAAEVQPHEPMLRAWIRSQFHGTVVQVDDIVQETFIRVLQTHAETPVRSPKAFLFVVARNLALMQVRHQAVEQAHSLAAAELSRILEESADVPHEVARAQELDMLTKAIQSLPTRCRQILTLRKIYGMALKDVAVELGLAEATVVAQTQIGLKKIEQYFRDHGAASRHRP
jgi:RNA polymerase sigma factor (sigma-70 family)